MTGSAGRVTGVTVLGTSTNSGKSCYTVGFLRLWRDRGLPVVPFKAVTVVDFADASFEDLPVWRRGVGHLCSAADVEWEWWHNPISVVPYPDGSTGRLYLRGEPQGDVVLQSDDHVAFGQMTGALYRTCLDAVHEAVSIQRSTGAIMVMEGAGAADQHASDRDLANREPARLAGLPILLLGKGLPGAALAARIADCAEALGSDVGQLIHGFAINETNSDQVVTEVVAGVRSRCRIPFLGATPQVTYPAYDGSAAARLHRYRMWAAVMEESIDDRLALEVSARAESTHA